MLRSTILVLAFCLWGGTLKAFNIKLIDKLYFPQFFTENQLFWKNPFCFLNLIWVKAILRSRVLIVPLFSLCTLIQNLPISFDIHRNSSFPSGTISNLPSNKTVWPYNFPFSIKILRGSFAFFHIYFPVT